jgi:hypothetical protein
MPERFNICLLFPALGAHAGADALDSLPAALDVHEARGVRSVLSLDVATARSLTVEWDGARQLLDMPPGPDELVTTYFVLEGGGRVSATAGRASDRESWTVSLPSLGAARGPGRSLRDIVVAVHAWGREWDAGCLAFAGPELELTSDREGGIARLIERALASDLLACAIVRADHRKWILPRAKIDDIGGGWTFVTSAPRGRSRSPGNPQSPPL